METINLKQRSDVHLARKIWHAAGVLLMCLIFNLVGTKVSWILLLVTTVFFVPLDFLRQRNPALNRATFRIFGAVMRKHESQAISGLTFLLLGCMVLLLFPPPIVTLTLLFLALGDPVASFFGIRFGKDKIIGNKTLQGTMAAFVVCSLIAVGFYYFKNIMTEPISRLLIVGPISGLIGAAAELIPIAKLDDNFTFPVLSAILLMILFHLFGGLGI